MSQAVPGPSAGIGHWVPRQEATSNSRWYSDWQAQGHASHFDSRAGLSDSRLRAQMEAFNDVRLLHERLEPSRPVRLLEVGCATGEFYRYLRGRLPRVEYWGMDISRPALARAKEKYPRGNFFECDERASVLENLRRATPGLAPEIVYSKDVLHHQTDPWGFLHQLLEVPSESLLLRTRTRDSGATVLDPDLSCQYHYQGWMPYIVLNLEELLERIRAAAPRAEVVALRHRMVLGGRENRFIPKECYLPETGTAETAVGVFLKSGRAGAVSVEDRVDSNPIYPFWERVRVRARIRKGRPVT